MYLERPLLIKGADAINITNNFIAETGSCIELTGASILGKITNNYLISAWAGYSILQRMARACSSQVTRLCGLVRFISIMLVGAIFHQIRYSVTFLVW